MSKPFCITFAWAVGSGKTPIATYLSYHFDLPIFNNDAILSEIHEDFWILNNAEYLSRREERLMYVLRKWNSFICDVSVDRSWGQLKELLKKYWYLSCIISLDISEELLKKFYTSKSYNKSLERLAELIRDHESFLKNYSEDVNFHITDEEFSNRLILSEKFIEKWIQNI